MFDKKAQMSAPFELLVAVIIMGFVIFFGMNALSQLSKEQCSKDLDKTMHDLVNAVELVTNQGAVQTINIRIPACYSGTEMHSKPKLYFQSMQSESTCSAYCKSYRKSCMLLTFDSAEEVSRLCVNISFFTTFSTSDICPSIEGYSVPPNITDEIPEGYYLIHNITSVGQLTPNICFYRQGQMSNE